MLSFTKSNPTFIHAVVPVGVGSEFFDGLTTQQADVGGLRPGRERAATQLLTVTFFTVLQTLSYRQIMSEKKVHTR